jgi:phytanoyl-CoA hydroxylase
MTEEFDQLGFAIAGTDVLRILDQPTYSLFLKKPTRVRFEKAYLNKYQDVAQAVREGSFASGIQHYEIFGKAEVRAI